jgi:hypothetical protein
VETEHTTQFPRGPRSGFGQEAGLTGLNFAGVLTVATALLKVNRAKVTEIFTVPTTPEVVEDGVAATMESAKSVCA